MGKIAFIIVNFLFLLGYNIYFGGEVTAEQKLPSEILRGEKFTIEVNINKGDREGFAKWQQEIPNGFVASPLETQGATFSFKKQNVKLIWMALPEEESFTISYQVIPEPTIEGAFSFEGKFSYIEENERKDITSVSEEIKIGSGDMLANNTAEEDEKEESIEDIVNKEDVIEQETTTIEKEDGEILAAAAVVNSDSKEEEVEVIDKTEEGNIISKREVTNQEGIIIERKILNLENGNYEVKLKIAKGENQSFGKIEEYLPPGYIAMEKSNNDGMFSFNNNVMKILWMALPAENEITVTYLMQSESDELDSATLHGVFSILIDDESYQLAMGPSSFKNYFITEDENVVADETTIIAEVAETEVEEIDIEEPSKEEVIEEISNIPSPETGVTYKVQIAAGKNEVNQNYFASRHNITEPVSTEFHNSWFKYTIGGYSMYKEARDKRNSIWSADNKIDDAFVTAYNSGERISVQEALMISNQKWIK